MASRRNFLLEKKYHYDTPCLEMKIQVIIHLTTAILQRPQKCCVDYFSRTGHLMLTLMFSQETLPNISTSWEYSKKSLKRE